MLLSIESIAFIPVNPSLFCINPPKNRKKMQNILHKNQPIFHNSLTLRHLTKPLHF